MPREPKPWPYRGHYRTNALGRPKEKLCPLSAGPKEAARILALRLAERDGHGQSVEPSPSSGVTVAEALDGYLDFAEVEVAASTYSWYRDKLEPFRARFARRPLRSLTLRDGLDYKRWLLEEKEWTKGKTVVRGLSPTTVNHHVRAAKVFLNWAGRPSRRLVERNEWEELAFLTERQRERVLTEAEFAALLAECRDGGVKGGADDFREQLTFLRYTGARPGEMRTARWEYVRWDDEQVVFPPTKTKTRKRRVLFLVGPLLAAMRARWERKGRPTEGFIFTVPGRSGGKRSAGAGDGCVHGNSLAQRFRRLVDRCAALGTVEKVKNGETVRPYTSRHSLLTLLVSLDVPLKIVQEVAGHASPVTTQRYLHLTQRHVGEAVRKAMEGR